MSHSTNTGDRTGCLVLPGTVAEGAGWPKTVSHRETAAEYSPQPAARVAWIAAAGRAWSPRLPRCRGEPFVPSLALGVDRRRAMVDGRLR